MKAVYKYILDELDQVIELPMCSKILSAENVNDKISVYALVRTDEGAQMNNYHFRVLMTGFGCENVEKYKFLDSVVLKDNGNFTVCHVFYKGEWRCWL